MLCILNINIIQYLYLRFTQSLRQGLGVVYSENDTAEKQKEEVEGMKPDLRKRQEKKGGIDY